MLRQDDGASPSSDLLAERLARTAATALEKRRPADALPSLDRLSLLPGQTGRAAALRAEALLALGRGREADAPAEAALAEAPGDSHRLTLRARAHMACGRPLQALDTAAAAVMAAPDNLSALLLFAALLSAEHRFDDAVAVLEDAARRRPENPQVQLRLGIALRCAGRLPEAEAAFDRCAAMAPTLPGLALARAQGALARNAAEEAIAIARHGLAQSGADAALFSTLGHALEAAGRKEEAAEALRAATRLAPENEYLAHLVAIADGAAPARAADGYVAAVFDGYAPHFEQALIGLGYRVPGLVRRALERLRPGLASGTERLGPVLDLGCGTGLVGVALHDLLGDALVGVDLSRRMLEEARTKGIYAELRQQELHAALRAEERRFDLITAGDVFCYLGGLEEALSLAAARLAPQGLLLFSVERGAEGAGAVLHGQGRYAHDPDRLRADLGSAGLVPLLFEEEVLRQDLGRPVPGLLVAAGRAAA